MSVVLTFGIAACCWHLASANLDYKRVHLVDMAGGNLLFRGNMPVNDTSFAVDALIDMMHKRAAEANVKLPIAFRLVDVTLNNIVDYDKREMNFWKTAPASFGELVKWPMGIDGVVSPHDFPDVVRKGMCSTGITAIDGLDAKASHLHNFLLSPNATVVYVHCSAGCDRTGEMIAAYRLLQGDFVHGRPSPESTRNISAVYREDVSECGRPPNYFSTTALKWFCFCKSYKGMKFSAGTSVADPVCEHFASCKTFGDCTPNMEDAGTEAFVV